MSEMTEMPTKRDEILDTAERMIRTAGYNGFSTRDVANAVGIKAASVHYYFPTKSDIGVAVTERYTERFLDQLGDPEAFEGRQKKTIEHYVDAFRQALVRDGNVCLCAVLGAEIGGLPMEVGEHARVPCLPCASSSTSRPSYPRSPCRGRLGLRRSALGIRSPRQTPKGSRNTSVAADATYNRFADMITSL